MTTDHQARVVTAAPWDLLGLVQREVQVRESPQHLVAARLIPQEGISLYPQGKWHGWQWGWWLVGKGHL